MKKMREEKSSAPTPLRAFKHYFGLNFRRVRLKVVQQEKKTVFTIENVHRVEPWRNLKSTNINCSFN